MFRSNRFRPLHALLAAIYIAIPGGAAGVRPCAHHDQPGAGHEAAQPEHGAAPASHEGGHHGVGDHEGGHHEGGHADHAPAAQHSAANPVHHVADTAPAHHVPAPAHAPHTDSGAGGHGPQSGCSCLDTCTAPVAVLPVATHSDAARPTGLDAAGPQQAADSPRIAQPDHFHPYPNAPPALPV